VRNRAQRGEVGRVGASRRAHGDAARGRAGPPGTRSTVDVQQPDLVTWWWSGLRSAAECLIWTRGSIVAGHGVGAGLNRCKPLDTRFGVSELLCLVLMSGHVHLRVAMRKNKDGRPVRYLQLPTTSGTRQRRPRARRCCTASVARISSTGTRLAVAVTMKPLTFLRAASAHTVPRTRVVVVRAATRMSVSSACRRLVDGWLPRWLNGEERRRSGRQPTDSSWGRGCCPEFRLGLPRTVGPIHRVGVDRDGLPHTEQVIATVPHGTSGYSPSASL
jgi:hypothetical protein